MVRGSTALALALTIASAGEASPQPQIDFAAIRATKELAATRIDEPIVLDGRLDEPAWERAEVGRDFYQQVPDEGAPATEPSEIRFLYDSEAMYVGATFFDSDPRGPIVNELKRDFSPDQGDFITVAFDTFNDQRGSFNFMINAAGAQRDTQSYDDGRQNNPSWDGVWWVKTARFAGGWALEMKVPFKTLRFPDAEEHVWGVNVHRQLRRKNEESLWSPVPRQFNQFKISYAGRLKGLRNIQPGRNLRVKPFYAGAASNLRMPGLGRRWDMDGGVDVKYGIGSALTLDATYRTDFSQVEVDEQQINLTRFSLFFPEKREFFLENQGSFRIGDQDAGGGRRDLLAFFSRRIGLSETGRPIPIVGGARLTGKQGPYSVGLLNIQTERFGDRSGENFTAVRVGRDFGIRATVSGFYLGRESGGPVGSNRVAGGELRLNFRRKIDVNSFIMGSATEGGVRGIAGRAALNISENLYRAQLAYTNIAPEFRNDLGFAPRGDIGLIFWDAAKHIRPKRLTRWVRTFSFGTLGEVFENSAHQGLLSRRLRAYTQEDFADGGGFRANVDWSYELLTEPFQVSPGVFIPPGEYRFRQFLPSLETNPSLPLSGSVSWTGGEFYDGTVRGYGGGVRLRVNERLAASGNYSHNDIDLPYGRFDTDLARLRIDCSFSTNMFLNAFVQYNSAARTWLTNIRYRFIYRPLSDVYVVYNDTRTDGRRGQRTIALKHTLLLSF